MVDPIITPAPVPPSIAGIPQPVFDSGSPTAPATPIPITGSPIIPPPTIGDPDGFPVFPPVPPNTAPVPVPVGPLVGPAVGPAAVPPSIPGVQQPQFVPPGSATVPASLFPEFTTTPPSPPIVFANVFKIGAIPPPLPSTPGQNPPPIIPSPVATIPQLPWPPPPAPTPPVNTVRPLVQETTDLEVGSSLALSTGTWTGASPFTYARNWTRNGSPIAGATTPGYVLTTADIGAMIGGNVTATDTNGLEASMDALAIGPVVAPTPTEPVNTLPPIIDGFNVVGATLTCDTGTWTGTPPTTFGYQWTRNGSNISGATSDAYVIQQADAGSTIGCRVTGDNGAGRQATVTASNTVDVVLTVPVNTLAPIATLNPTFILCTGGNWTPNPPMWTLSYQWYSPAGTLVAGATGSSWTFAGHEGETAYCAVRASNSAGQSAPTNTNTVTIPAALADEEPAARTATARRPKRKKR